MLLHVRSRKSHIQTKSQKRDLEITKNPFFNFRNFVSKLTTGWSQLKKFNHLLENFKLKLTKTSSIKFDGCHDRQYQRHQVGMNSEIEKSVFSSSEVIFNKYDFASK